jgi:hypothetical protein
VEHILSRKTVVLQGTSEKLCDQPISLVIVAQFLGFQSQIPIVLEEFRIPMGIRIYLEPRNPEFSIPPSYAAVGPKGQYGPLFLQFRGGKQRAGVSGGQKCRYSEALGLFLVNFCFVQNDEIPLLFIPTYGKSPGHDKELAPLG